MKILGEDLTALVLRLLEKAKKDEFGPLDNVIHVNADVSEGEALGKAYSATGQSTSYSVEENYCKSTPFKVYYERSKKEKNNDKTAAAEMAHSPVVENLVETQQIAVAAQVNGKIKNEFGGMVVTPQQDLYEKERVELFNRTNKALKELIYATSGVVTWFIS